MNSAIVTHLLLVLTVTIVGCAQVPVVCEQCDSPWQSTNMNSAFVKPAQAGFEPYKEAKRAMLAEAKYFPEWVTDQQRGEYIEKILPAHVEPDGTCPAAGARQGIILIHGLFDTPFIMQDLARHFSARCFHVYTVLLTGHGTRPGDLLGTSRQAWKDEVRYIVNTVMQEVDELYIGGFSLGGDLSILAASQSEAIKGVFLFAPALKPMNSLAYGSYALTYLSQGYFKVFEELDFAKYESLPHRAGMETYKLGVEVKRLLDKGLKQPIFLAVSLEDATIDARHTLEVITKAPTAAGSQVLVFSVESSEAEALCGVYTLAKGAGSCTVRSSHLPDSGIKSLSHVGLVVNKDNEHYGEKGDYRNCLYVKSAKRVCLESRVNAQSCSKGVICYGEAIWPTENPIVRRITFNPLFEQLTAEVDRFLDGDVRATGADGLSPGGSLE